MKRILFPTDFSTNSIKAIYYGLNLYGEAEKYILLHTFEIPYTSSEVSNIAVDTLEDKIERKFNKLLEKIDKDFPDNNFDIETEFLTGNLVHTTAKFVKEEKIKLIIMGTQGATGIAEVVMGNNTTSMIKSVDCPVIAIPIDYIPKRFDNIIFAFDYKLKVSEVDIFPLLEIAKITQSEISVLHVSTDNKHIEANTGLFSKLFGNTAHSFHTIKANNIGEGIEEFADSLNASLLAMVYYHTNIFDSIFHKSVTKKMTLQTKVPLLVMKHEED